MAKKPKTISSNDLDMMSMDELQALAANVKKAMATVEKRRRKEARNAIEKVAREYGMSVSDVLGGTPAVKKSTKAAAPAKFANPADPSQTWSGRGRQPAWYKEVVAGGADPSSLAI